MMKPYILTIAGHDSCGGAGMTADIETVQNLGGKGLSVCTALTVQNDLTFKKCIWTDTGLILEQLELLMDSYPVQVAKIGIVENMEIMHKILGLLQYKNPGIRIIWDPVLKSGSGYAFHDSIKLTELYEILEQCYLITPNYDEIKVLSGSRNIAETIAEISSRCHLFLKGGHRDERRGTDILYRKDSLSQEFPPREILNIDRHGSGCVLSTAIATYLAQGYSLEKSCELAKEYTYRFLLDGLQETKPGRLSLQYISQGQTPDEHLEHIRNVCLSGGKWIQLRMKDYTERDVLKTAFQALDICKQYDAKLLIDDHVSVAKATGADGVHLGKNDLPPGAARKILGPGFIIGGTANTIEDIEELAREKVDYIGLGPFRFTTTKKNLSPVLGVEGYSRIMEEVKLKKIDIPIIAIGGITREDIVPILKTGIAGIAVSGLLTQKDNGNKSFDLEKTIATLQDYFQRTTNNTGTVSASVKK
ncbi:thiamine phosphate synthase [Sinomicrobium sp. M5D2P9]